MTTFHAFHPATGAQGAAFTAATSAEVDTAALDALAAFHAGLPQDKRATLLDAAADEITALGDTLLNLASQETGLAATPRLAGERDRTVFQLRMFAQLVREGSWVEAVIDRGDDARKPLPKPDVRRMLRPLGPVAVFGASNFPMAYSVAGGDTASALATGCPVLVKGHPAHPGTGQLVADAMKRAVARAGLPAGTFAYLQAGGDRDQAVGQELVSHPAIKAVGFTGSPGGGMALVKLANARPVPIPVFAEMGSVNPVVILPAALAAGAKTIGEKLANSAIASGGQMCTCPGLIFALRGPGFEDLVVAMSAVFAAAAPVVMLSPRVHAGFIHKLRENSADRGVTTLTGQGNQAASPGPLVGKPTLLRVSGADFIAQPNLAEECFGPSAVLVECDSQDQLLRALGTISGSLTGALWADARDDAARVHASLESRVGRLIFQGVPTGVEVCAAMIHSGPYPACNRPDTTAVGAAAVRRWCRPVCYQNAPDSMLPEELRENNPLGIFRIVDGKRTEPRA